MTPQKQPPIKLLLGVLLIAIGVWIIFTNLPQNACPAGAIHQNGSCVPCSTTGGSIPLGNWFCQDNYIYPSTYEGCIAAGFPNLKTFPASCEVPGVGQFWEGAGDLTIDTFVECGAAGNPIMESYPRQCKTSEGTNFVEKLPPGCTDDSDCGTDSICNNEKCEADPGFLPKNYCKTTVPYEPDSGKLNYYQYQSMSCAGLFTQTDCENGGTPEWLIENPPSPCEWVGS
jgi:hypothetical protein